MNGYVNLTKADIWNIKEDIRQSISYISECLDYDRDTFWYHGMPCFNRLDERVKQLKEHIINTDDYELAKQIASYERYKFTACAHKWYSSQEWRAGYIMLTNIHWLMYDIYRWLATEYYKIPDCDVDKYYMKDSRLYDEDTKEEYRLEVEHSIGEGVPEAGIQATDKKVTVHLHNVIQNTIYNELPAVTKDNTECVSDKKEVAQDTNETPASNPIPTFHSSETAETLKTIFQYLKKERYIDAQTNEQIWLYVCGKVKINSNDFLPINWTCDQESLAILVYYLFMNSDNKSLWKITEKVFTINGKVPNTNSMKSAMSKYNKDWKDVSDRKKTLIKMITH